MFLYLRMKELGVRRVKVVLSCRIFLMLWLSLWWVGMEELCLVSVSLVSGFDPTHPRGAY